MDLYTSPQGYLYNLQTSSAQEARRLWKKSIKDEWENKCAYCDSNENLTIDHIIPQSKGGNNFITNVICCCESCNKAKAHSDWEEWYQNQSFYSEEKRKKIYNWTIGESKKTLYTYRQRRNNAS